MNLTDDEKDCWFLLAIMTIDAVIMIASIILIGGM